jgi:hypothetical protein
MGIDAQPITALEEPKREANGRMPMRRNEMWCIRLRLPSHCRGGMNQFVQISLTIRKVELRWCGPFRRGESSDYGLLPTST